MSSTVHTSWISPDSTHDVVNHLHRILISCRGGNKILVSLLCNRIAEVHGQTQLLMQPSPRIVDISDQWSGAEFAGMEFNHNVPSMDRFSGHQDSVSQSAQDENSSEDSASSRTFGGMLQATSQSSGGFSWEGELLSNLQNRLPTAMMRGDGYG